MRRIINLFVISALVLFSGCSLLPSNDYGVLPGSEWSNEDESQGLKFFSDGSVLFFLYSSYGTEADSGMYQVDDNYVEFSELSYNGQEITSASIQSSEIGGLMKVYWHQLGKSNDYYINMYRRR